MGDEVLKKRIMDYLENGNIGNLAENQEALQNLQRIVNDHYQKEYRKNVLEEDQTYYSLGQFYKTIKFKNKDDLRCFKFVIKETEKNGADGKKNTYIIIGKVEPLLI